MIDDIRRSYFLLMDKAVQVSGNSKKELHEYFKMKTFPFLYEDPDNFTEPSREIDIPTFSTKHLSEKGWQLLFDEFRHFCVDKFNI